MESYETPESQIEGHQSLAFPQRIRLPPTGRQEGREYYRNIIAKLASLGIAGFKQDLRLAVGKSEKCIIEKKIEDNRAEED